eukprot:gnl/TRDRNA2_/TRDRNA2_163975_c1_seq2.p2 gnl/TRDRNA2_/TRDRNA2_163975_c1~~gnl/TRDRNA2_/TRDRNA2_163975_c1_seq2.p2  ORF type:complete len:115 (-),score=12.39 gnl/TRDRNA2_/TRDRNA2_163975_c1_seq2:59-403(-)
MSSASRTALAFLILLHLLVFVLAFLAPTSKTSSTRLRGAKPNWLAEASHTTRTAGATNYRKEYQENETVDFTLFISSTDTFNTASAWTLVSGDGGSLSLSKGAHVGSFCGHAIC